MTVKSSVSASAPPIDDAFETLEAGIPTVVAQPIGGNFAASAPPPSTPSMGADPPVRLTKTVITKGTGQVITSTTVHAADATTASANPIPWPRNLGKDGASITCPHCRREGKTRTRPVISVCTWIAFIVLLLLFWPLCWLPFICNDCQDTSHRCQHCNREVGDSPAQCCRG